MRPLLGVFGGATAVAVPTGPAHICNCIGCCEKCGMCRTFPKHNAQTCAKIADLNEQRRQIIMDA